MVTSSIVISIAIFEVWLKLENIITLKSRSWRALTGILTLLIYIGLGAGGYQSIRFIIPAISMDELKLAVLVWAIVILVYILKFFAPRRKYNSID